MAATVSQCGLMMLTAYGHSGPRAYRIFKAALIALQQITMVKLLGLLPILTSSTDAGSTNVVAAKAAWLQQCIHREQPGALGSIVLHVHTDLCILHTDMYFLHVCTEAYFRICIVSIIVCGCRTRTHLRLRAGAMWCTPVISLAAWLAPVT